MAIGGTVDGKKEIEPVHKGVRDNEEPQLEVLRDQRFSELAISPERSMCKYLQS